MRNFVIVLLLASCLQLCLCENIEGNVTKSDASLMSDSHDDKSIETPSPLSENLSDEISETSTETPSDESEISETSMETPAEDSKEIAARSIEDDEDEYEDENEIEDSIDDDEDGSRHLNKKKIKKIKKRLRKKLKDPITKKILKKLLFAVLIYKMVKVKVLSLILFVISFGKTKKLFAAAAAALFKIFGTPKKVLHLHTHGITEHSDGHDLFHKHNDDHGDGQSAGSAIREFIFSQLPSPIASVLKAIIPGGSDEITSSSDLNEQSYSDFGLDFDDSSGKSKGSSQNSLNDDNKSLGMTLEEFLSPPSKSRPSIYNLNLDKNSRKILSHHTLKIKDAQGGSHPFTIELQPSQSQSSERHLLGFAEPEKGKKKTLPSLTQLLLSQSLRQNPKIKINSKNVASSQELAGQSSIANSQFTGSNSVVFPQQTFADVDLTQSKTHESSQCPSLIQLDRIFSELAYDTEICREHLICQMYKNPGSYLPYSGQVAKILTAGVTELKGPLQMSNDLMRFYKYMQAAVDGQDQIDCPTQYVCPTTLF